MTKIIDKIPQSLRKSLINHACIPFVGSGLSIAFGVPTWKALIASLKSRCDEEKCNNSELIQALSDEGDYLNAAQKAKDKLGKSIFKEQITKEITNYDKTKNLIVQQLLWSLSPPLIMTTNFDTLLEDSINREVEVITPLHKSKLADLVADHKESRILFKVHGSINEFESLVFTSNDYKHMYDRLMNTYQFTFATSILKHNLLFIGFSLADEAILNILSSVKELFNGFSGTHYALVRKSESRTRDFWEECSINVIEYEDHTEIESFLRDITGLINTSSLPKHKEQGSESNDNQIRDYQRKYHQSNKLQIPPSNNIPNEYPEIKKQAIGECIILAVGKLGKNGNTWGVRDINSTSHMTFFKPKGTLASVHEKMEITFRKSRYISTPRYSLRGFKIEPKISYRAGGLILETELTDWSLIHGLQSTMVEETAETLDLRDRFWASVNSLITKNQSLKFPHHLATHCLLISKDNKVVLNKRLGVENQQGRISASFEEQMQFPFIFPSSEDRELRYFDGDTTPFDTVIRGAEEELNIKLSVSDIRILALCMESSSVAANFLAIAKSQLTVEEIYDQWTMADDKNENRMIPPDLSPKWNVEQMVELICKGNYTSTNNIYDGIWHASTQARILLGLIADFGIEEIKDKIDIPKTLIG